MKSTIQAEAEKAAKKIREALLEFNRVTGFELKAQAEWKSVAEPVGDGYTIKASRVIELCLDVSGFEVRA